MLLTADDTLFKVVRCWMGRITFIGSQQDYCLQVTELDLTYKWLLPISVNVSNLWQYWITRSLQQALLKIYTWLSPSIYLYYREKKYSLSVKFLHILIFRISEYYNTVYYWSKILIFGVVSACACMIFLRYDKDIKKGRSNWKYSLFDQLGAIDCI